MKTVLERNVLLKGAAGSAGCCYNGKSTPLFDKGGVTFYYYHTF